MAIIRWNPWNIDRILEDDWDIPTLPGLSRLAGQGLNIYETADKVVAEVAMPGVDSDRIDITVDEKGIVRVTGSGDDSVEEKKKRRYFMSSMTSSYNYSFRLPPDVAMGQEPKCELENGVLRMEFERQKKQPPKRIKVNVKGGSEKITQTVSPKAE